MAVDEGVEGQSIVPATGEVDHVDLGTEMVEVRGGGGQVVEVRWWRSEMVEVRGSGSQR